MACGDKDDAPSINELNLFGLWFNVPVNSYGHVEAVS